MKTPENKPDKKKRKKGWSFTPPPKEVEETLKSTKNSVKELKKQLKSIDNMHDEIVSKLEDVYQKGGTTYYDIQNFLNDSKNFTKKQWKYLEKQREALLDRIWQIAGEETKKVHEKKVKKKQAGDRKRKTLGGRKKWIPMK